ncbi:hypothetical protein ACHAXR_010000, partial [Thalassiosira sp. AJA248-18]
FGGPCEPKAGSLVKAYVGHTRFATSSIASFDGTHPHQWTPPRLWRCYNLSGKDNILESTPTLVENFITHNGDFDFYELNGMSYGLDSVQAWLQRMTSYEMPSAVDSAAIAGVVDILHTQGCFALSIRYAVGLGLTISRIDIPDEDLPAHLDYANLAQMFELALNKLLEGSGHRLDFISAMPEERQFLEDLVLSILSLELQDKGAMLPFAKFVTADEEGGSLAHFVRVVIDAFFDNDLLWTVKTFLHHAKGSFGLCVSSSQSAHRQLCVASRGQTNSLAFSPKSGIICYGSEQAAVKAGTSFPTPGGDITSSDDSFDGRPLRLDLDDVNGEICLVDWGGENGDSMPEVSPPNRHLPVYKLMNGRVNLVLIQEGKEESSKFLHHRMTLIDPKETSEMDLQAMVNRRRKIDSDQSKGKKAAVNRHKSSVINVADIEEKRAVKSDSRSAAALQGAYHNLSKEASKAISEHCETSEMLNVFNEIDKDGNGKLNAEAFIEAYNLLDSTLSKDQVFKIFMVADHDNAGYIDFKKFLRVAKMSAFQKLTALQAINRPRMLLQVEASRELYFGEHLRHEAEQSVGILNIERSQHFSMELYEGRIASLQRFVAMTVMFHEMGKKVENFFSKYTFGIPGYRYDRTHSIMRIANTASPVSGADVRERIHLLKLSTKVKRSLEVVTFAWRRYRQNQQDEAMARAGFTSTIKRSTFNKHL